MIFLNELKIIVHLNLCSRVFLHFGNFIIHLLDVFIMLLECIFIDRKRGLCIFPIH